MPEILSFFLPAPERFPLAVLAVVFAAVVGSLTGPVRGNANPFFGMLVSGLLSKAAARLDKTDRGKGTLAFRGLLVTVTGLGLSYGAGLYAQKAALQYPLSGFTEIFFLSLALTCGSVWYLLLKLYFDLREGERRPYTLAAMARSTGYDLSGVDEYGVVRAGMGYVVRAFDKGLVAPVLWYVLAGLPGAFIYTGLQALAARFGRDGCGSAFGQVPLALEKLMGVVPSLLSGLLLALAGLFTPTGGMTPSLAGLMDKKGGAPYVEGGLSVTAVAHALNVILGGPVKTPEGEKLPLQWVGPEKATAQLEKSHLRRALYIVFTAQLLLLVALPAAMMWGSLF